MTADPTDYDPRSIGRFVRDAIYDYVLVPHELAALVEHPLLGRLRTIAQNGLASRVYPGLTATRYEHSLGVMHLAIQAAGAAIANATPQCRTQLRTTLREALAKDRSIAAETDDSLLKKLTLATGVAGLIHDVGHTPLSHTLESFFRDYESELFGVSEYEFRPETTAAIARPAPHERYAQILFERLNIGEWIEPALTSLARYLITGKESPGSIPSAFYSLCDGDLDVDRLDYLRRDNAHAGTEFGAIDTSRITNSYELHLENGNRWFIAPGKRARSAVETMLSQRLQSHRWVYFHPRVVAYDIFADRALRCLMRLEEALLPGETFSEPSRAMVETGPDRHRSVAAIFRSIRPDLNYVKPPPIDRVALSPFSKMGYPEDSLNPGREDLRPSYYTQILADDVDIIGWIRRASPVARALLGSGDLPPAIQTECARFLALAEAAFGDADNWLAAWKSVEEYESLGRDCWPAIEKAMLAFEPLLEQYAAEGALQKQWAQQMQLAFETMRANRIVALNWAFRLLQRDRDRRYLEYQLSNSFKLDDAGPFDFWIVQRRNVQAIKDKARSVWMYDGPRRVNAYESSAMIQGLVDIERQSTSLFAYYVRPGQRRGLKTSSAKSLSHLFVTFFNEQVAPRLTDHWLGSKPPYIDTSAQKGT